MPALQRFFTPAVSVAPMAMTLRCQLEDLFIGEAREGTPRPRGRQVALTAAAIAACLAPALAFPRQAEKVGVRCMWVCGGECSLGRMVLHAPHPGRPCAQLNRLAALRLRRPQVFAVTGATAVCAVVYIMPVAIHLRLFFRRGGSDCLGWLGAKAPRRQSFSFDLNSAQPGAAAAAGTRWLLADDHLGAGGGTEGGPPLPSLQVGAPQAQPSQQAQQAAGLRLPAAQRLGQAADEEEGEAAAAASAAAVAMRGHRSDLSLNRWVRFGAMGASGSFSAAQQTAHSAHRSTKAALPSPLAHPRLPPHPTAAVCLPCPLTGSCWG